MAIRKIHLRKLLQIFDAPANLRQALLREDIRSVLAKEASEGDASGGGDFHGPFWSDCKTHVSKTGDLLQLTDARIAANGRRKRLYPRLAKGFLDWWNTKSRINEPYEIVRAPPKGRLQVPSLESEVKVENLLCARVNEADHRLGYPYFAEEPALTKESARLGLWVLSQTLNDYSPDDFRILDVLRSASLSTAEVPLQGNEEQQFLRLYAQVIAEWEELRKQY